jgi:predicted glycosyltransferase involved in capsule biosynthesis
MKCFLKNIVLIKLIFCRPLFIIATCILFFSCEKVIDINLNKIAPKYVIEGTLSDEQGDCKVIISQSVNFNELNNFKMINGAIVSITDGNGTPVFLSQDSEGVYQSPTIVAKAGHKYSLSVNVNGQQFSSVCQVPLKVSLDSLYIIDFNSFGDARKFANVIFKDPAGIGNAYRFLQFKNRVQNSNIFVLNDDFSDGRLINTFLAYFDKSDEQKIKIGDSITVQMQCIDSSVYKFFSSLSQSSSGDNNNVAPGNAVSNITGGALGYFSAYTKDEKTVIVK